MVSFRWEVQLFFTLTGRSGGRFSIFSLFGLCLVYEGDGGNTCTVGLFGISLVLELESESSSAILDIGRETESTTPMMDI